jgi:hypothetical protein
MYDHTPELVNLVRALRNEVASLTDKVDLLLFETLSDEEAETLWEEC